MPKDDYVHQHLSDSEEYGRLRKIEEFLDPRTRGFLQKLGLKEGMSFLEAGAGGGSLLPWLSHVVGPTGKVLAVDMDTRFIRETRHPNLQVLEDDLTQMDLGSERFDFIHERYVLNHIPDPWGVLKKMRAALKPGGWLLVEDVDSSGWRLETGNPARLRAFKAVVQARKILFAGKGLDYAVGRLLPGLLRQAGFTKMGEETFAPLERGGERQAEIMRLSTLGLWDQYLSTGAATEDDLRTFVELAADPNQEAVYYSTVSAWGQKRT
jgi:2-polyprenyl-3-methyl-5-hydroxy-6-metoxy-1,4-benzoquinol methylase